MIIKYVAKSYDPPRTLHSMSFSTFCRIVCAPASGSRCWRPC